MGCESLTSAMCCGDMWLPCEREAPREAEEASRAPAPALSELGVHGSATGGAALAFFGADVESSPLSPATSRFLSEPSESSKPPLPA